MSIILLKNIKIPSLFKGRIIMVEELYKYQEALGRLLFY
jgi:hypothetical protein